MRILLCQLSDIHFKGDLSENEIFDRVEQITNAIISRSVNCDNCFLVFSGDISFSGRSDQYNVALEFITRLTKKLEKPDGFFQKVYSIFVPGNHDCNFGDKSNKARDILINSISTGIEIDDSIIQDCTYPQNNFFDLCTLFDDSNWQNKLYDLKMFSLDDKRVLFLLLNTSWISQKKEKPGQLFFPEDVIPNIDISRYDAVIAVLHHPLNWFIPMNGRNLKNKIEKLVDIIITGHEHCSERIKTESSQNTTNGYYMGGVMQEHDRGRVSQFNIVVIDLSEKKEQYCKFEWNGSLYSTEQSVEIWNQFLRNKILSEKRLSFNEKYYSYLEDISVKLNHPAKENLFLSDLYFYPDIEAFQVNDKNNEVGKIIKGENVLNFIKEQKKLLITGPDNCGKTTLAKRISVDLLKDGIVPIIINPREISTTDEIQIRRTIKRVFIEQYKQEMYPEYELMALTKKAILIDDFNRIGLNTKGIKELIAVLYQLFNIVIILADDYFKLQYIASKNNVKEFLNMGNCSILDYGYLLRDRMIKKWYTIGREYSVSEKDLLEKCEKIGKLIDTVIGKGLVPSYPIYILLLLNQYEVANNIDTKISSYGYLYQTLINNMLMSIDKDNDNISINDSYLTELAFYIFSNKKELLSIDDILEVNEKFYKLYAIRISPDKMINAFLKNQIFDQVFDKYKIKYKYVYYYFVAKYFGDNINNIEIKSCIGEMSKKIYIDEYANILLFLCHLKKEQYIIDEIMLNAMVIFDSFKSFDFENYIQFIKQMYDKIPKIYMLLSDNVMKNRENQLKMQDKYRYQEMKKTQEQSASVRDEIEDGENELNNILSLNRAFKTLEILGQILKNYPGKIFGETKYNIALECHNLGMRIVEVFLEVVDSSIDILIKNVIDDLGKKGDVDPVRVENTVRKFIYYLVESVSLGMVKKVADSIANDKLVETYKELLKRNETTSFKLINLSIKFDCLNIFSPDEIIKLNNELCEKGNKFAQSILKRMVVYYMYLHKVDFKDKNHICQELGIGNRNMTTLQLKGESFKRLK